MKDLKKFYEEWSNKPEGDQSKWLAKGSPHYDRFMSYLLLSKSYINKNSKVLDIGCGEGNLLSILPECKKYGVDIAYRYTQIANKKNPGAIIKVVDIDKKLPFKDNYFDFIFCTEVIEHVNNPSQLLKEIKRLLHQDGKALISTYNHWNLTNLITLKAFTNKFVSEDHLREYNIRGLKKEMNKIGLKAIRLYKTKDSIKLTKIKYLKAINKFYSVFPNLTFLNIIIKK